MKKQNKMNDLLKKVFQKRNITEETWLDMNDASYPDLNGIDEICCILQDIQNSQKKLVVLPDFDMDGIMSGTVAIAGFSSLGFDVELFIPNPEDGYGFKQPQIDRLIDEHPDVEYIITCDTGISCRTGVEYAASKGLKVLITDHHKEDPTTSPRDIAMVVVDPCAIEENYDHPGICGAFVMWQVLKRYAETYGTENDVKRIDYLRVFPGIGTISDTMPLLYENRKLVLDALNICHECWECSKDFIENINSTTSEAYKAAFRGLYAAMNMFSGAGKLPNPSSLNEEFFGFYMAPAFNSVKRMDGNMSRAFDVFLGNTPSDNVNYLLDLNEKRKSETAESLERMLSQSNPYAPYCYITDAKPGIRGLLATKIQQRTGMPCIVAGKNNNSTLSGSGRCPVWYPFFDSMEHVRGVHMSGHEGAFGFSADDETSMKELYQFLCEDVPIVYEQIPEELKETECDLIIAQDGSGDTLIDENSFIEFVEELEEYRPFGKGFEAPSVMIRFDHSQARFMKIGAQKNHLKIQLTYDTDKKFDILCWNQADILEEETLSGKLSVVGNLGINEFAGKRSAQMTGELIV